MPRMSREKATMMITMGSTQDTSREMMGFMGSTYSVPSWAMPCSSSRVSRLESFRGAQK